MGFLDHTTNNIIVDAVLTDEGRKKLASAKGLSIIKYAFADTEVDYTLLKKYGEIVGREKIEKNTPIYEASTSGFAESRHSLLTDSSSANVERITATLDGTSAVGSNTQYNYVLQFQNFDPQQTLDLDIVFTHKAWDVKTSVTNSYLVGDPNGMLKRAQLASPPSMDDNGNGDMTIILEDEQFTSGTKNAAFEIIERGGVTSSAATITITK